jgi:DNA-binding response OmpR family regulator
MASLLVVEDDQLIASSLSRGLRGSGYEVVVVSSVAEAMGAFQSADLVLCDLGLPDGDGLDLIATMGRQRPSLPIVALTARAEEADVVAGLSTGAVDYVVKPFRLAELQARIAAQLRQSTTESSRRVCVGDLVVDSDTRRVFVGGEEVELRPKEFDLLARLAVDAGRVVSREVLMHDVWDEHWWGSTKTLDVHLNALRRKLGEAAGSPSRITAIRRVGYRLESS